jgi:hypothetical protein
MEAAIASRDADLQSLRRQIVTQITPSPDGPQEAQGADEAVRHPQQIPDDVGSA